MKLKLKVFLILLAAFFMLAAFVAAENAPRRVIRPITAAKIVPEKASFAPATFTPISGTPTQISAVPVERAKDECTLAGSAVYNIIDWFTGMEWYANYQDPEEYGCVDVWPFQVTDICFRMTTETAVDIIVQGVVFESAGPLECPVPSDVILCQTPTYEVTISEAGYWDITLPLPSEEICCVNSPYFAGIYISSDLSGTGTDAVSADDMSECYSYMYRGVDWEDLVTAYGWPGQMLLFSQGYTDPQNPCTEEPGDCDTLSYHGGINYYWPIPDTKGDDFLNERFDIPYNCYLKEIHISFYEPPSSGAPDAHIYVWESDGTFPIDPAPPSGAIAEFVIPHSDLVWYPQKNVIETEMVGLNLVGTEPIHVGFSHPKADLMDTLAILSDDGTQNSDRSIEFQDGTWRRVIDDWGIGLDFFIEIVVCPDTSVLGCCQLVEFDCVPATEWECDNLGGAWYPPPATCTDYADGPACTYPYPRTMIVEPSDTSIWGKNYFSDTLTIQAIDFQPVSNVEYTVFEYFDGASWQPISTDYDGTTYMRDPADPLQPGGDGWHAAWYPEGLTEGYYMIRATMVSFDGISVSDTVVQYWDPVPPEVTIIYPDVFNFPNAGPLDIQFYTPGDNISEMYVIVYPIPDYPGPGKAEPADFDCIQGYNKGVPHLNQNTLYPNGAHGNQGCVPTSIAACLKYWAQNGHPCLNDNGAMTDGQMVGEIAGLLGTHPDKGTGLKKEKAAIEAYIKKHCGECKFQPVNHLQGKDVTKKRLIKELFEEDEDVITGDKHHVTVANSFCVHPKFYIDYMDPATGTEVNQDSFNKGFDGDPLIDLIIVSPKETTVVVPPETTAFPEDIQPVPEAPPGTYHHPWYPEPEIFPVGTGYFVNVEVTDILGHKGWDLVKVELFIHGDTNGDGNWNLTDAIVLLNYLFKDDVPPFPLESGDANCNDSVDLGDAIYMLNYLFKGGDPPGCD
jgi:hypothetical protein